MNSTNSSWAIVVLSYNHPELTARTVESVLLFKAPVFLVHNGSDPRHIQNLQDKFQQIQHLIRPKNGGFSAGANFGIQQAFSHQYPWILFVTNDCLLIKAKVPTQNRGLGAPLIYRRKVGAIDSLGGYFSPGLAKIWHNQSLKWPTPQSNHKILPYVPGTAFWIHQSTWHNLDGFDEQLETYWEDVDLSCAAQKVAEPLFSAEDTQLIHAVGKTNHKNAYATSFLFQRNRHWISRRHLSGNWLEQVTFNVRMILIWGKLLLRPKLFSRRNSERFALLKKACAEAYKA